MVCSQASLLVSRLVFTRGPPRCLGPFSAQMQSLFFHTASDSPVRAPPRLPRRSCRPSSLSCLLNFSDFPGPEFTSGLLHFRNGMGGGDNMWSSCREKDSGVTCWGHSVPPEGKTNQSHFIFFSLSKSLSPDLVFNLLSLEN